MTSSIGLVIAMLLAPDALTARTDPKPRAAPTSPIPGDRLGRRTKLSDPGGRSLKPFHKALKQLHQGTRKRVRAVFYGASHMAADAFTKIIRHRLQGHFGDGGPGFVVPAKPWRNYNHRDVNIKYSKGWRSYWVSTRHNRSDGLYGMAGCSFESSDADQFCRVSTRKRSEFGRSVSKVELYFWRQPKAGDLKVIIDDRPPRIVTTASDTPGPGYLAIDVPEGEHSIELRPVGNGNVLLFGMALERDAAGVVVDTMGINGARAAALLQWDAKVFTEHLERRKPDLVVLAYGTNATGDEGDPIPAYMARLDKVLTQVRAAAPQASCIYVGPSDRPVKVVKDAKSGQWRPPSRKRKRRRARRNKTGRGGLHFLPRPRQREVIKAQKRIAHKHGCAYWDWVKMMGGPLSMVKWVHSEPRLGARDYVHLTKRGYSKAANLFWRALMKGYGRLPVRPTPGSQARAVE